MIPQSYAIDWQVQIKDKMESQQKQAGRMLGCGTRVYVHLVMLHVSLHIASLHAFVKTGWQCRPAAINVAKSKRSHESIPVSLQIRLHYCFRYTFGQRDVVRLGDVVCFCQEATQI